jgi:Fur family iron response transcriptional regulator
MQMNLTIGMESLPEMAIGLFEGAFAEPLRQKLRGAGLSLTRQRLALGSLLFLSGDRHVTVEMLCQEANTLGLPLTSNAVASGLRQFVKAGLLREVALYGSTIWYDTNIGPHCHFYDEDAGRLYDMPENLIPQFFLPVYGDIDVIGVDVIVRMRRPQP